MSHITHIKNANNSTTRNMSKNSSNSVPAEALRRRGGLRRLQMLPTGCLKGGTGYVVNTKILCNRRLRARLDVKITRQKRAKPTKTTLKPANKRTVSQKTLCEYRPFESSAKNPTQSKLSTANLRRVNHALLFGAKKR